jgi:hypothetical protein
LSLSLSLSLSLPLSLSVSLSLSLYVCVFLNLSLFRCLPPLSLCRFSFCYSILQVYNLSLKLDNGIS